MSFLLHNRSSFLKVYIIADMNRKGCLPAHRPAKGTYPAYALCLRSSETLNFFLPLALRAAKTRRPFAEAMRSRKPCLFLLFLCEGWKVLFMTVLL